MFTCGVSSAFLGVLGLLTGIGGVFSRRSGRLIAGVGIGTSLLGICLLLAFLAQFGS